MQILKNTLEYHTFLAEMSDNWEVTKRELESIERYAKEHNIICRKGW